MKSASWRIILMVAAMLVASASSALTPEITISQFKHSRWNAEQGAPGTVQHIIQAQDGWLWLSTSQGMMRFDGLTFEKLSLPDFISRSNVTADVRARDGTLWMGFADGTIATLKNGKWRDTAVPKQDGGMNQITRLAQTADGRVWASFGRASDNVGWHDQKGWHLVSAAQGLAGGHVMGLVATRDGRLWVSLPDALEVLRPGQVTWQKTQDDVRGYAGIAVDAADHVWIADDGGTRVSLANNHLPRAIGRYRTPPFKRRPGMYFDREGSLWGITPTEGVFRIAKPNPMGPGGGARNGDVQRYTQADGLISDVASGFAEDREGNIWIGSSLGLERFRAVAIVPEPIIKPRAEDNLSMHRDAAGDLYIAGGGALYKVAPGGSPQLIYPSQLNAGCTSSQGEWWGIDGTSKLLSFRAGRFSKKGGQPIPSSNSKLSDAIFACAWGGDGKLWIAEGEHGLYYRTGKGWQPADAVDPLLYPAISLQQDDRGRVLALSFAGILSRIDGKRREVLHLGKGHLLPSISAFTAIGDDVLIGSRVGLAKWSAQHIVNLPVARFPILKGITGIAQTPGETWLQAQAGIVRLRTRDLDRAFADTRAPLLSLTYNYSDGLPGASNTFGYHGLTVGGDGRVWISSNSGVGWIDPKHIPRNLAPPPIVIRTVRSGDKAFDPSAEIDLPKGTSAVQIDFAVLSLTMSERNLARYRLSGVDKDWVDAGSRRQAFYTNLSPGTYHFTVIGSNNDGVWNNEGQTIEIQIPPAFLQSIWFKILIGITLILLGWTVYSLRVRHISAQLRLRLADQAAERERIARELHDTLLQGVQGMILRFHMAAKRITTDLAAKAELESALDSADDVLIEARDRVRNLRRDNDGDLALALGQAIANLSALSSAQFETVMSGSPRRLDPLVSDEMLKVASEALLNAARHAHADKVIVRLTFDAEAFGLEIVDDGIGFVPATEIDEHSVRFGLRGMRERVKAIGGACSIRSAPNEGTGITITVPAKRAFDPNSRAHWWSMPWNVRAEPTDD